MDNNEPIHIEFADDIKPLDRWTAYMWAEAGTRGLSSNKVYISSRGGKSMIVFK